ncbi:MULTISPECIES: tail protein X [Yersinia pseudotuberculosis complex]|uniref:Phage tail protein n=2 Tax=Yersinia pseudotuberculosis complex TaxID=1649845 RepID=A0ABM7ALT5_YERPU|nr:MULTISPECIES: tail protein X [Yersinia pseudotuberculosis complex]AYW93413.1 phage tail protein [Yersinia pseudotuberculosis]KGA61306.1 phage Tail Protein X family protein [Yersinia pseudotuberculosis]MBO1629470.1 tail protein X [Yersinia pseudotuberculosis]MBP0068942.1 phage tail protein [Yersinia pseudotuberculosis]CNE64150.1 WPhiphage-related tail protein [Yersinia pseudotuberculosis]
MRILAQQYDTIDAMCWRYYGRTEGVTEKVLAANPGLADIGPVLPHGYPVEMPEVAAAITAQTVQLWD